MRCTNCGEELIQPGRFRFCRRCDTLHDTIGASGAKSSDVLSVSPSTESPPFRAYDDGRDRVRRFTVDALKGIGYSYLASQLFQETHRSKAPSLDENALVVAEIVDQDSFADNRNNWMEFCIKRDDSRHEVKHVDQTGPAEIREGHLRVQPINSHYWLRSLIPQSIPPVENFVLVMDLVARVGEVRNGHSFIQAGLQLYDAGGEKFDPVRNYTKIGVTTFAVDPHYGHFFLSEGWYPRHAEQLSPRDWKNEGIHGPSSNINLDAPNVLTIVRRGPLTVFYINNIEVRRRTYRARKPVHVGIYSSSYFIFFETVATAERVNIDLTSYFALVRLPPS